MRYISDQPTIHDALGFNDYRQALTEILLCGETPLVVGIYGRWGSGKTSLLKMLREDVQKKRGQACRKGKREIRTVWFTAWKYQRQEALWRAFILRVLDALYPREKTDDVSIPWEKRKRVDPKELEGADKEFVEKLLRLEASLYAPVEWTEQGRIQVNLRELAKEGSKVVAQVALNMLPGVAALKSVTQTLGTLLGDQSLDLEDLVDIFQRETRVQRMAQMTSMEQFERAFQEVLRESLGEDGRLLIFIDDLDRCLPEKAIEILEAIKLFLNVEGTVFVLGLDKDIIRQGIEIHYCQNRANCEKTPIHGDDYLEKIVQIPFHIPPLEQRFTAHYVDVLLNPKSSKRFKPITWRTIKKLRQIPRELQLILAEGIVPNPRQIKRVLNTFHLLQTVALIRDQRLPAQVPIPPPLLAKVVILQVQYPEFFNIWMRHPDVRWIQDLERGLEQDPPMPPSEAKEAWKQLSIDRRSALLRLFRFQLGDGTSTRFQKQKEHVLERLRTLISPLAVTEGILTTFDKFSQALQEGEEAELLQAAINLWRWRSPWVLEEAKNLLKYQSSRVDPVVVHITTLALNAQNIETLVQRLLDAVRSDDA